MKIATSILAALVVVGPAAAAPGIQVEIGASYFDLREAQFEPPPGPLNVDEATKVAPFIAAAYSLSDAFGFRLSYHFVNNLRATGQFHVAPGVPPSPVPIIVWAHYHDDVHLLSVAPELKWSVHPRMRVAIAPQLNWVASRGVVSYSTNYVAITLVPPRKRNDDGFTLGGSARFMWLLGTRSALSLGYQFVDLDPSFERKAHVFSGGVSWDF